MTQTKHTVGYPGAFAKESKQETWGPLRKGRHFRQDDVSLPFEMTNENNVVEIQGKILPDSHIHPEFM